MSIHLICNAHLDPVWLWRWEEGASECLSTFRAAADFCEEYDGFVFNHNESVLYKWVEEYDEKLFARIRKLVSEGKWHIMGGWFIQPDCNMPKGESFVRQALTGKNYFKEKFGVNPTTAINFDSFGHSRGLVQILKKFGYDSYIICRPGKRSYKFENADFIWKGYDGSEIIVHRSDENYNSVKGQIFKELPEWLEKTAENGEYANPQTRLFLWGVGNHGGGPSRKDLDAIKEIMKENNEVIHSNPESYFKELNAENLPVVERGLNPVAQGCYTSQIRIKQKHRQLENDIYMAEKMSVQAELNGLGSYPKKELDEAIYDMMTAEFHDALPGSGIKSVEEDTLRILDHGLEITSRIKARNFFKLSAGQPKLEEGTVPVLVYNPHPFKVKTMCECEFVLPQQNWKNEFTYPVVYQNGEQIPSQAEKEESNFNMDWKKKAVFWAELEPCQINRFDVKFKTFPKRPVSELKAENGYFVYKNERMEVRVNCETGLIDKYCVDGFDYLKKDSFKPEVIKDAYNSWGWGKDEYKKSIGSFTPMSPEEGTEFSGIHDVTAESVRVIEDGEARLVIEAMLKYNNSFICQRYKINKNDTDIQVEATVFWNEKEKMLKLAIPSTLQGEYIGQTVFGREVLKTTGEEVVSQEWSALCDSDKNKMLAVINDGTYGSDCFEGVIRPTMLRSAGYSASDFVLGKAYRDEMYMPRMEQGERTFNFWIKGGSSDCLKEIDSISGVFNQKPYALPFCPSGEGEKPASLIVTDKRNIILSSFKKSEDEKSYIIRLYESCGEGTETEVKTNAVSKKITFKPFEIKTFRLSNNTLMECEMSEEN